jgi:hypothetical protein
MWEINENGYSDLHSIIKLKDNKFKGQHPNGIFKGHTVLGFFEKPPTVGERFYIECIDFLFTSPVTRINDDGTFNTENSLYSLKKHERFLPEFAKCYLEMKDNP